LGLINQTKVAEIFRICEYKNDVHKIDNVNELLHGQGNSGQITKHKKLLILY